MPDAVLPLHTTGSKWLIIGLVYLLGVLAVIAGYHARDALSRWL